MQRMLWLMKTFWKQKSNSWSNDVKPYDYWGMNIMVTLGLIRHPITAEIPVSGGWV